MKNLFYCFLVAVAFAAQANPSQEIAKIESDFKVCFDQGESTRDFNNCSAAAYEGAVQILVEVRKKILEEKKKNSSEVDFAEIESRIKNAATTFQYYREASCKMRAAEFLGGSGEGVVFSRCVAIMTIDEVKTVIEMYTEYFK